MSYENNIKNIDISHILDSDPDMIYNKYNTYNQRTKLRNDLLQLKSLKTLHTFLEESFSYVEKLEYDLYLVGTNDKPLFTYFDTAPIDIIYAIKKWINKLLLNKENDDNINTIQFNSLLKHYIFAYGNYDYLISKQIEVYTIYNKILIPIDNKQKLYYNYNNSNIWNFENYTNDTNWRPIDTYENIYNSPDYVYNKIIEVIIFFIFDLFFILYPTTWNTKENYFLYVFIYNDIDNKNYIVNSNKLNKNEIIKTYLYQTWIFLVWLRDTSGNTLKEFIKNKSTPTLQVKIPSRPISESESVPESASKSVSKPISEPISFTSEEVSKSGPPIKGKNYDLDIEDSPYLEEDYRHIRVNKRNQTNNSSVNELLVEPINDNNNKPLVEPINDYNNEPLVEPINDYNNEPLVEPINDYNNDNNNESLIEPINDDEQSGGSSFVGPINNIYIEPPSDMSQYYQGKWSMNRIKIARFLLDYEKYGLPFNKNALKKLDFNNNDTILYDLSNKFTDNTFYFIIFIIISFIIIVTVVIYFKTRKKDLDDPFDVFLKKNDNTNGFFIKTN